MLAGSGANMDQFWPRLKKRTYPRKTGSAKTLLTWEEPGNSHKKIAKQWKTQKEAIQNFEFLKIVQLTREISFFLQELESCIDPVSRKFDTEFVLQVCKRGLQGMKESTTTPSTRTKATVSKKPHETPLVTFDRQRHHSTNIQCSAPRFPFQARPFPSELFSRVGTAGA